LNKVVNIFWLCFTDSFLAEKPLKWLRCTVIKITFLMKWFINSDTINPQRFNEGWCKFFHIVCNVLTLLFTYDVTDIIKMKKFIWGINRSRKLNNSSCSNQSRKSGWKQRSLMRLLLSKPKKSDWAKADRTIFNFSDQPSLNTDLF
jgi:hypothetical protein